jgi:hypothetical protein
VCDLVSLSSLVLEPFRVAELLEHSSLGFRNIIPFLAHACDPKIFGVDGFIFHRDVDEVPEGVFFQLLHAMFVSVRSVGIADILPSSLIPLSGIFNNAVAHDDQVAVEVAVCRSDIWVGREIWHCGI